MTIIGAGIVTNAGLIAAISRWRRMVADVDGNVWTDTEAAALLADFVLGEFNGSTVYDVEGAAAAGWRELAAAKSHLYKFTADGASFERGQWFDHCAVMANMYEQQRHGQSLLLAWDG